MEMYDLDQNLNELLGIVCKAKKKFGLYISFQEYEWKNVNGYQKWIEEVQKACPLLKPKKDKFDHIRHDILYSGSGFFLFDTRKEMEDAYEHVVGDDGPTKFNSYSGEMSVYALTFDSDGQTLNSNT